MKKSYNERLIFKFRNHLSRKKVEYTFHKGIAGRGFWGGTFLRIHEYNVVVQPLDSGRFLAWKIGSKGNTIEFSATNILQIFVKLLKFNLINYDAAVKMGALDDDLK